MRAGIMSPGFRSPDKNTIKKKQSKLKTIVQDYGKLVVSWNHDGEQVQVLLNSLQQLVDTETSVLRCNEACTLSDIQQIDTVLNCVAVNIYSDIVALIDQLRVFDGRYSDLNIALVMLASEASNAVTNEDPQLFSGGPDLIFTVDHMLEIQALQKGFAMECQRKRTILQEILCKFAKIDLLHNNTATRDTSVNSGRSNGIVSDVLMCGNSTNTTTTSSSSGISSFLLHGLTSEYLQLAAQNWSDNALLSFVNVELINLYLSRNNIVPS